MCVCMCMCVHVCVCTFVCTFVCTCGGDGGSGRRRRVTNLVDGPDALIVPWGLGGLV
jgi:hypothetical protein